MRALFTCHPALGHFLPLTPIARALDQEHLAPEHVREVILHVLRTSSYRRSAERLRDEIERLPSVELAVDLLEQLARDKAPIIAPR